MLLKHKNYCHIVIVNYAPSGACLVSQVRWSPILLGQVLCSVRNQCRIHHDLGDKQPYTLGGVLVQEKSSSGIHHNSRGYTVILE